MCKASLMDFTFVCSGVQVRQVEGEEEEREEAQHEGEEKHWVIQACTKHAIHCSALQVT